MDIPAGYEDLFDDSSSAFLMLATLRNPGEPVVAPVWFVSEPSGLLFTSDADAAKVKDVRARPRVAGVVMAEGEHVRYVSVRGYAAVVADPAADGIDVEATYRRIVRRYEGHDPSGPFEGVLIRLVPDRLTGYDYRDAEA